MWLLILSTFLSGVCIADTPEQNQTMVVEAYRDIQVYVAPIKVIDQTDETRVEAVIDANVAFTYTGLYSRNAKVPKSVNSWQPVGLGDRDLKIYSDQTIKYVWSNCDYKSDPLGCSVKNDHYFLETTVHVDDNQLVVKAVLYDADAQVVNVSTQVDKKIIKWIKQQETNTQTNSQSQPQNQMIQTPMQNNCGNLGCNSNQLVVPQNNQNNLTVIINKPKEELPLKWEIPHTLTDKMLRQAMMGIWTGVRLKK